MGKIAFVTAVFVLGCLNAAAAQTTVPAVEERLKQANSNQLGSNLDKYPALSLSADNISGVRSLNGQFQILKLQWNENKNDRNVPYKSYNPISIPLW